MRIRTGDEVEIITGKQRGERGKIEQVFREKNRVLVTGINIVKRHQKGTSQNKGGIIEKPAPIDMSNVMLVCPKCNLKTRVGVSMIDDTKKRRCKKCGKEFN